MSGRSIEGSTAKRVEADAARSSFEANVALLRERLNPQMLVDGAVSGARDKAAAIAGQAGDAVRSRPVAAGMFVGIVSALFARRRKRMMHRETAPPPVSYLPVPQTHPAEGLSS